MASKGRPAGSTTRTCLIKDKLILPYEIHIDETTSTYLKVVAETQSTSGYYQSLPHLIRSIAREKHNSFSEDKLIEEISKLNFKYPHIVLAQAILETGHFESKIFVENNNLFGMKEARIRLNLAEGTQYGHAYYNNWKESVTDYALWYSTFAYKCKSEKQLYKLLNKQYAEANYYPQALKRIIEKQQLKLKFKK